MFRAIEERPAAPAWPARLPFYYGWVQVVLAAVAMSATLPGRTYGLGLIKEPLRADLGLGDLRFNELNFWAIVIGAACVLPIGRLIDRLGTRAVLGLVAAGLGSCVWAMSRATNVTDLAVTLTLVRGLGQGALSVVAIALVGKWFRRRAGVAMGAFTLLLAVGFVAPIFVVEAAVKSAGWRVAWEGVGLVLLLGLLPLGLIFARSSPEACGVAPDEKALDAVGAAPLTLRDTLATPSFWVYTAAATVFNLVFSALTLDNQLLLEEHGLDGGSANALILGVLMLSGLPANVVAGYLARNRPLGKLLAGGVALLAVSLVLFPFVNSLGLAALYAALLGASGGVITVIYFAVYGHTYGRTHLGTIQATVQVLSVFASASGPLVLAWVRARGDGTALFFYLFAGVTLVLAAAAWVVRPPARVPAPVVDEEGAW
jgi:MFS family permease